MKLYYDYENETYTDGREDYLDREDAMRAEEEHRSFLSYLDALDKEERSWEL